MSIGIHSAPRRRKQQSANGLTAREAEAVLLAYLPNKEIAALMGVGVCTVKTLLNRAFVKLGVETRAHAVLTFHKLQSGASPLPLPLAGGGGENPATLKRAVMVWQQRKAA